MQDYKVHIDQLYIGEIHFSRGSRSATTENAILYWDSWNKDSHYSSVKKCHVH